jgi:hypothetical protein
MRIRTLNGRAGALLALGLLAAAPAQAEMPMWFDIGGNFTRVDEADLNCGGAQGGFAFGSPLLVKAQWTALTFEADDDGGDCDLGWTGDSSVNERAIMAGLAAGPMYIAAGPAAVNVHETSFGPWGKDTGTRIEVGYQSRLETGSWSGFEVLLFGTTNEVRNYGGLAIGWTFGPGQRRLAARHERAPRQRGSDRY